jgi:hypothetical protein
VSGVMQEAVRTSVRQALHLTPDSPLEERVVAVVTAYLEDFQGYGPEFICNEEHFVPKLYDLVRWADADGLIQIT